jgi:hypothetical protein
MAGKARSDGPGYVVIHYDEVIANVVIDDHLPKKAYPGTKAIGSECAPPR